MSEEGQTPEPESDKLVDLSSLEFGPAWARTSSEPKKEEGKSRDKERREERGDRRGDDRRRGGDDRRRGGDDQRRGGGDRRRGGGDRRGGEGRGRGDDRSGGGKGRRFDKGGRGKHGRDRFEPRQRREEVPPPEGVAAQVMPVEDGLDALGREILASGRTYSVFDLAKLVLGARERFNVGFRCNGEQRLFRCRKDGAVWLTKSEALRHFWTADWRADYYEEVVTSADPPRGNFQAVARCGLSGELLGPPNYHGYQTALMQMHRERYAHMSLDAYKNKIRMERDEEVVNAWLEKMSQRIQFRPTGGVNKKEEAERAAAEKAAAEKAAAEKAAAEKAAAEKAAAEMAAAEMAAAEKAAAEKAAAQAVDPAVLAVQEAEAQARAAEEEAKHEIAESLGVSAAPPAAKAPEVVAEPVSPESEEAAEEVVSPEEVADEEAAEEPEADEPDSEEAQTEEEEPEDEESDVPELLLNDRQQVERHFLDHHFEEAFHKTERAWVAGGIAGKSLSPGLLTLLRQVVAEERRYPGKLTPMLCRQLSGRHVAVFKWRKKLKAGPSRPHAVPNDITLADRPTALLAWLKNNSGKNLEALWSDLMEADADEETKHLWYHDLHWILNQGYGILLSDSSLHLAKREEGGRQPAGKGKDPQDPKEAPKEASKEASKEVSKEVSKEGQEPPPDKPTGAPVVESLPKGSAGLYGLGATNLAGESKSCLVLSGRGLWPLQRRLEGPEDEEEEEDGGLSRW